MAPSLLFDPILLVSNVRPIAASLVQSCLPCAQPRGKSYLLWWLSRLAILDVNVGSELVFSLAEEVAGWGYRLSSRRHGPHTSFLWNGALSDPDEALDFGDPEASTRCYRAWPTACL